MTSNKEVILPLCSALVRHIWSIVSHSGLPSTRETWTYWRESNRGHKDDGLEHVSYEKRRRELGLFHLEKRKLSEKKGAKRTEPGSFQWCPVT